MWRNAHTVDRASGPVPFSVAFNRRKKKGDVAGLMAGMRKYGVRPNPAAWSMAERAAGFLADVGTPEAIEALAHMLEDPEENNRIRELAAGALGQAPGERALHVLIEVARTSSEGGIRWTAVRALGNRHEDVFDHLLMFATDKDFRVREAAINVMGQSGDRRAVEPLIQALSDTYHMARSRAASGLGNLGDPHAVEPLIGALSDESEGVRSNAASALAKLGDPRAAGPVRALLNDPTEWVRKDAARALDLLGMAAEEAVRETIGGLTISDKPKEAFLGSKLEVFMRKDETMKQVSWGPDSKMQIHVSFPALCSGCLEPTDRIMIQQGTLSWEHSYREGNLRKTTTESTSPTWRIPLCERCGSYGMRALMQIRAHVVGGMGDWVSFRFPNLTYYRPFAETNNLEWGTRVTSVGFMSSKVKQSGHDTEEIERALDSWATVEQRLGGLHRYLEAKKRLLAIEERYGGGAGGDQLAEVATDLSRLAEELALPVDSLHQVARVANEQLHVLTATQR